jgi:hypothetical protein
MAHKKIKLKDIKQSNCVLYEKSRKELRDTFIKEGYDIKKETIKIGADNKIINGNHRYCLLLEEYGEEHEIVVDKIFITYGIINIITTTISILLLPIIFPYYLIKDYYKNKNEFKRNCV